MPEPQFHPDPPFEITEEDLEEEEIAEELALLEDTDPARAARRIEALDAVAEDNTARVRLAEQLIGEELVEVDDGDSEDDEDLELEEPDGDDGEVDDNVDESPSDDGADDEWPEQEEHGWDLCDETELDY